MEEEGASEMESQTMKEEEEMEEEGASEMESQTMKEEEEMEEEGASEMESQTMKEEEEMEEEGASEMESQIMKEMEEEEVKDDEIDVHPSHPVKFIEEEEEEEDEIDVHPSHPMKFIEEEEEEEEEEEDEIDVHPFHPVKFIEDLKVDGEKEVICGVCEDPVSGPSYKCSKCEFACHKSCAEIPKKIEHPLHPHHTLSLRPPMPRARCDACGKSCRRCFFYSCQECKFILDTKCSTRWQVKKVDCDQHAFVPFLKQMQFTCEGCGEERKDIGWICSKCQLLTHTRCAPFSQAIKVAGHEHFLTLTYSIQEVKKQAHIACEACYEEVDPRYAAYYCQHCSYIAHLRCAKDREIEDRDGTHDSASNSIKQLFSEGHQLGLIKDMNQAINVRDQLERIQHFSHSHDLILHHEEVPNDKVCDACMQLITIPFYSCIECNYVLHSLCATIPTKITPSYVPYTITVLSQASTPDGVFQCKMCNHYCHGFVCLIPIERITLDIQCLKTDNFQHKGHKHPFFAFKTESICKACGENTYLVCSQGEFALCHRCITLPLIISHKDDAHPLELTYTAEDKSGEYFCLICERERDPDHWFYYCASCNFAGHPQCVLGKFSYIKIGKTYKDERHQHPLTFVRKINDSHSCDACGLPFGDVFLQCEECKQKIHPRFGFNSSACLKLWKGKLKINPRIGFCEWQYDDED